MGLKKLGEKIAEYKDRLEHGKASEIKPSHVEKKLEKLRKKSRELEAETATTQNPDKKVRLEKKLEVTCQQIERAGVGQHRRQRFVEQVQAGVSDRPRGEAAVAADDRRDAVEARGRRVPVPEQLGVVVSVRIDESRADDLPLCVDRAGGPIQRRAAGLLDGDDASVPDAEVALLRGASGSIDEGSVLDDDAHGLVPFGDAAC